MERLFRVWDAARAVGRLRGSMGRVERASRTELLEIQRRLLRRMLEHAAGHSPFYAKLWSGLRASPEDFRSLPTVAKADLLDRGFDEALTDRSLSRRTLQPLLGSPRRGRHVVLATSGTTGEPVIVPYSRREWIDGLAACLRGQARQVGGTFRLARLGRRVAAVATRNPIHASAQIAASFDLREGSRLSLAASAPIAEQVVALNGFQPTLLAGYPSALAALAAEALEGRLRIAPKAAFTGGEVVTRAARARLAEAWGIEIFDCYGLTETLLIAWECRLHHGLHLDEDRVIVEPVDAQGNPVAPGELSDHVLLTSLCQFTLPILRYRVTDRMAIRDDPCPCGSPMARIVAIEGRRDETLSVRGLRGEAIELHATAIETILEEVPGVRRFQIVKDQDPVVIRVVPREGAAGVADELRARLGKSLAAHQAAADAIRLEMVDRIDEAYGKTDKARKVIGGH